MNKQKYILIVDDDPDDQEMLQEAIKENNESFKVICINNGVDAIQWLKNNSEIPEFIFLDLNLPKMNGMQCLKKIKSNEHLSKIPIIIYSTSKLEEDKINSKEQGADCFITKPDNFKALKEIIFKVFQKNWNQISASQISGK